MSAIGDYIHLTGKGYVDYGISRPNTTGNKNKNFAFAAYKKRMSEERLKQSSLSIAEKEKLQKDISAILSTQDNSKSNVAQIQNFILNKLYKRFEETLQQIDWESGDIKISSSAVNKRIATKLKENSSYKTREIASIMARVRAIEDARNEISDTMTQEKLNSIIQQIYKDLNFILTGKSRGMITELKEGTYKNTRIEKSLELENLVTLINQTIKDYAATPAVNLQKGELFEYVIALVPALGLNLAEKTADEIMANFSQLASQKIGDSARSRVTFNQKFFSSDLMKDWNFKGYANSPSTQTTFSYHKTQDKIDVALEWEEKGKIGISAKNVNLSNKQGVTVVSGTSLLYLIQDENPDFVNHFLNMYAIHSDGVNSFKDMQHARWAMQYAILIKAITGDTYGRPGGAELFIVNDNSKSNGGVHVYEIADLMVKANKKIDVHAQILANGTTLEKMRIANPKRQTPEQRITEFLHNVHAQKIKAILKPSVFTES